MSQSPSPAPSSWLLVGGSRSLPESWSGQVSQVLSSAIRAGYGVSVGCAAGADAYALSAALRLAPAPGWLRVFAIGTASGDGFWRGSAPLALLRSAAAAGHPVAWQAGGGARVPFRARLLRRSQAALAGCTVAVFFLSSPGSPGSLRVAAAAAQAGARVFAFACGFSGWPAPLAGCAGSWQRASLAGLACWSWRPAQPALF